MSLGGTAEEEEAEEEETEEEEAQAHNNQHICAPSPPVLHHPHLRPELEGSLTLALQFQHTHF